MFDDERIEERSRPRPDDDAAGRRDAKAESPAKAPDQDPANPPGRHQDKPAPLAPATAPATPASKPEAPSDKALAAEGAARRRKRLRIGGASAGLIALAAAGVWGQHWYAVGRYRVSTDDAYIGARNATLSPKVSGYVASVAIEDNARVQTGDVIARIDDGDYKLAVQSARDQVAVQQAAIDRIGKQVGAQQAAVEQARAQLTSNQAVLTRTGLDLKRQRDLAVRKVNTETALEQAQAAYDQAAAGVRSAEAGITAAEANVAVLKAQQEEAARALQQQQTALAKAERDLSFTIIRAPFDGVVGNRAVQVGDYVQPTQRLASLVPLTAVYVDANFKETQLARLKPGQPVSISVDAVPGREFQGRVASFAPASGSVFSILPPDNATGNFTKIVQRLPVRVELPADVTAEGVLRPGMSVIVTVDTKSDQNAPAAPAASTGLAGQDR